MIFKDILNNITDLRANLVQLGIDTMVENEAEIIDLNTSQVEQGLSSEGGILGEYENDNYAAFKQSIGSKAPAGIVDLKLTGDFISGFYAEPFGGNDERAGLFIDSRDGKSARLESKYDGIFGVAPENQNEFQDIILTEYKNKIIHVLTR